MRCILSLAERTKQETGGFFDIANPNGILDPSGVVKGWAIGETAKLLEREGYHDLYVEAGGDIQTRGKNGRGTSWTVGIRNPFNEREVVKMLELSDKAVATSGIYERGQHIYDPHAPNKQFTDIVSISVVGDDICDADRFATAAFAMGERGIHFIEQLPGFEGFAIDRHGIGTETSGFRRFLHEHA